MKRYFLNFGLGFISLIWSAFGHYAYATVVHVGSPQCPVFDGDGNCYNSDKDMREGRPIPNVYWGFEE